MSERLKDLIKSPDFSGGSLTYHALQPWVEIDWLDNYAIARAGSFVIGEPLAPKGESISHSDLKELRRNYPHLSFVHIGPRFARSLKDAGYNIAALGSEALVDLPFSLAGAGKSDLRRALNRSLNAGARVQEISARDFPRLAGEIENANAEWLKERPLFRREFRFLARPFVPNYQRGERRFLAFQHGRAVGLAVYDPIISNGSPCGYFEAIIRSYRASPPGVRDLLTVTAINQFSAEGVSRVSLGLCPFRPAPDSADLINSHLTDLALKIFYRCGERVFNCRGLAFHKSRYRPCFKTVYFATLSPFVLNELYQVCRLSNIDALYLLRRPFEAIPGRIARSLFRERLKQSAL